MDNEERIDTHKLEKQVALIVEEDRSAATQMRAMIESQFKIKTICTGDTSRAKRLLKNNIAIKYLITSYDITEKKPDRLHYLAEYCHEVRPDVRRMGVGTFEKNELMFGNNKVFLQSTKDFSEQMTSLVYPHIVFLEEHKKNAEVIHLSDLMRYPYDV